MAFTAVLRALLLLTAADAVAGARELSTASTVGGAVTSGTPAVVYKFGSGYEPYFQRAGATSLNGTTLSTRHGPVQLISA